MNLNSYSNGWLLDNSGSGSDSDSLNQSISIPDDY